ncbi:MAG TPA: ferredoxin [Clostridium sp.]|nr:ferredoxin [Clostridium sp.]
MELKAILYPVLSLGGLGLLFGLLLGYANDKFKVEVDERIPLVRDCLPGANCGGCGFAGCDAYAEAVVSEGVAPNLCSPGGSACAEKISNILGVSLEESDPKVAYVRCKGTCGLAKEKSLYFGIRDCNEAMNVPGNGSKACIDGCLGLGSCVKVCQFDALEIVDGVARIIEDKCVACGACVNACPKGIIGILPKNSKVRVQCNSKAKGKEVIDVCSVGCITCSLCAKNCPKEAIVMENNLPVIDYDKCVNCGICSNKCPKNSIENLRKLKVAEVAN